ncbi:MAG: hypothetical protein NTW54_09795 [Bacteroidetes bacterium]|nr:hypothetical protein [Bacteroidota bacterium]
MMAKFFLIFIFIFSVFPKVGAQTLDVQNIAAPVEYAPTSKINASLDKHFKVGLFFPFFKDGGDTTALKHAFALSSLDYLAGVKVAIDSIEKVGAVNIDFYVEDTELDSSIVETLLMKEAYQDLDVLIGPIFQSGVEMATSLLQKRKTILYLPFEKDFKFNELSNIFSSQKNSTAFASYFASYFAEKFKEKDQEFVFLFNSKDGKNGREAQQIDSLMKQDWIEKNDTSRVKIIDLGNKEYGGLISKLDKRKSYVFFINTKNSYYANEALAQIKAFKSGHPEVFCLFDVLESEAPDYETWDSLKVKFFSRLFVNFEDFPTGMLRKKIIESYNQDPVEFTYKGYNDILFLSQAFAEGRNWIDHCLNKDFVNEISGFFYVRDLASHGIFNGYHAVWRYEKLKLYRLY